MTITGFRFGEQHDRRNGHGRRKRHRVQRGDRRGGPRSVFIRTERRQRDPFQPDLCEHRAGDRSRRRRRDAKPSRGADPRSQRLRELPGPDVGRELISAHHDSRLAECRRQFELHDPVLRQPRGRSLGIRPGPDLPRLDHRQDRYQPAMRASRPRSTSLSPPGRWSAPPRPTRAATPRNSRRTSRSARRPPSSAQAGPQQVSAFDLRARIAFQRPDRRNDSERRCRECELDAVEACGAIL